MRYIILLLISLFVLHAEDNTYELGQGMQIEELPLYVGGYTSIQYKEDRQSETFSLDDVALMLYGGVGEFSYMTEVEYKDLYVKKSSEFEDVQNSDRNLYIERLYLDYTNGENYTLRVGKYNSPIGYWNMLPINVLRETTSNPKTTDILYPQFTTGVGVSYSSYQDAEIKYDLMLQSNRDLDDKYNSYEIDRHFGAGITYKKNDFSIKLNGGYFRQTEQKLQESDRYYLLTGFKYEINKLSLMGEIGTQKSDTRYTTPYAFYLQTSYTITPKHSLNFRLEGYEDKIMQSSDAHEEQYEDEENEDEEDDDNYNDADSITKKDIIGVFGYTYRPSYPIAFKIEYQLHKESVDNQFLTSFSVLF
ncbi:outer membrane beta-barrel protein [Sulfurimonas sp.]|uniref:outer membrane beta-barrel protein n=1 Tax=Sulfurimonas sp. TaxID=2022749 RepID=UPI003D13BBB2